MKVYNSAYLIFFLAISVIACSTPGPVTISEGDMKKHPNLVEVRSGEYVEMVGLKNYKATDIIEMMKEGQADSVKKGSGIRICGAFMQNQLKFDDVAVQQVSRNLGYITLVESRDDYGITTLPPFTDTLGTIKDWNIKGADFSDGYNVWALGFLIQFLRTNGEKLFLKKELFYKQFATDKEKAFKKAFLDHINALDMETHLPLAREVLKNDGNKANRIWAMMILMRSNPSKEDITLLFKQTLMQDDQQKSIGVYVLRESLKLPEEIDWSEYQEYVRSLINGASIWKYEEMLNMLTSLKFPPQLAGAVLDSRSPVLEAYLNSFEARMSRSALTFINHLSEGKVKNIEQANSWLGAMYDRSNKKAEV